MAFATAEPLRPPRAGRVRSARIELADGARTMVHVARHDTAQVELRVAVLRGQARLEPWCAARGLEEALVGGFFVRPDGTPLGEVRTRGVARRPCPSPRPGARTARACTCAAAPRASRPATSCPSSPAATSYRPARCSSATACPCSGARRTRGLQAGHAQFDSDITDGRYRRAALGLADGRMFAVACDGRGRYDTGLTLEELAALMAALGCTTALNLDGGGSTSLVSGGRLRNRPRGGWERPEVGGRPVSTALLFVPR